MSEHNKGKDIKPGIGYTLMIIAYALFIPYQFPKTFSNILTSIQYPSWNNTKHVVIPLIFALVVLIIYYFVSRTYSKNSPINKNDTMTLTAKSKSHYFSVFVVWLVRFLFVFTLFYYLFSKVINERVIDLIIKYPLPILCGFGMTLLVSACSIILGSLLGCIMAFILTNSDEINFVKSVVTSLIYVMLSVPALVIILVVYYSVKWDSIFLDSVVALFIASVVALSINLSPFVAKIIASSISNIPKNQVDAAKGFGFNKFKILRKFTIPFVIRHSLQPLLVEYYTTIKLSSLAGYIGLVEAFHTSQEIIKLEQDPLSAYIILTICYVVLVAPIAIFADALEKWYRNKKTQL